MNNSSIRYSIAEIVLNENNANIVIPHAISENNITITNNITNSNLSSKRGQYNTSKFYYLYLMIIFRIMLHLY